MEGITLFDALYAVLGNGAMGMVVFYAWGKLEDWFTWLAGADFEMKRVGVAVLSFIAVQPVFWFGVLMLAYEVPVDWRTWVTQTFYFASIAFMSATLTHGAAKKE